MKPELRDKEVLAMYDVRGIQNYIFKSNVAKEIIGASRLVEKIITEGLQSYIETLEVTEQAKYMKEWETDDAEAFLKDTSIKMQIMFVGGGNAYVLFRTGIHLSGGESISFKICIGKDVFAESGNRCD